MRNLTFHSLARRVEGKTKMKLTKQQLQTLRYVLRTQIEWDADGCFGNGDEITEKKDYQIAKRILTKIDTELDNLNS